jgi:hypothetical protein
MLPAVQGRAHLSAEVCALLEEKGDAVALAQVPDVPGPLVRMGRKSFEPFPLSPPTMIHENPSTWVSNSGARGSASFSRACCIRSEVVFGWSCGHDAYLRVTV